MDCLLKQECKDGCVNVTKDGGKGSSRACWNKNDAQEEGCNKYGDEEICICYTELCNYGPIKLSTINYWSTSNHGESKNNGVRNVSMSFFLLASCTIIILSGRFGAIFSFQA